MKTKQLYFDSHGKRCAALLHLPDEQLHYPIVIMGHGFGAEICFGTQSFIRSFLAAGIAVFCFDYRHFGRSEGEPRLLIDPGLQCQDWLAALAFVRTIDGVNAQRIALWGSSFGGGHVLSTAAVDSHIRAVVAQVPHCDSRSAFKRAGIKQVLRAVGHGMLDQAMGLFGCVHRVPLVGEDGQGMAVLSHTGWKDAYLKLAGASDTWQNQTPARSLLKTGNYNPIDNVGRILCPVMIVYADSDQGIPAEDVKNTASRITQCELFEYNGDHFDLYDDGMHNEVVVQTETEFLCRVLCAPIIS